MCDEGLRGAVDKERVKAVVVQWCGAMVVLVGGNSFILVEALRALLSSHRVSRTAGTALLDDGNRTLRFADKNTRS